MPDKGPVRESGAGASRSRRVFALVLCALALPLPVLVHVMQSGLVEPRIPADTWLREPILGGIHGLTGLPATVSLWLLPLLVFGLAWAVPTGFERLVRVLRIDPHDRAWTSFTWALRSWRGALRWLAIVLLPTIALGAALVGLANAGIFEYDALNPRRPEGLAALLTLSVSFFVLDARNYHSSEPPRRWSPRWPTRQVWFLFGALLAVVGLVYLVGMPDLQAWVGVGPVTPALVARLVGLGIAATLVSILLSWAMELVWLSRTGWSGLPSLWRRGLHPRVLAISAIQWIRPTLYVLAAALPVVAWGWFFVAVMPHAESSLRDLGFSCCANCCALGGFWSPVVATSHWLVAWWWALGLGLLFLASMVLEFLLPWFGRVAWARLMVELGIVEVPGQGEA